MVGGLVVASSMHENPHVGADDRGTASARLLPQRIARMRTPSENLRLKLQNLGLCTQAQLASCQKEVERLCDGLPEFDSVWLDVLVQKQILSRFQADRLQQGSAEALRIDELILREQLGERSFLALTSADRPVVIQRRPIGSQSEQNALRSIIESLHSNRKSAPPGLAVPIRLVEENSSDAETSFFVAGPYQSGWTVSELIVRGGRLPWRSVLSIGHQILPAIEWLHQHGCVHGSVNANNIRISSDGSAVLVGALSSRFGEGGISLSATLTYEEVRSVAPERILNLQPANFQSDLYSFATVLWNMLSGRDAFLSTDPVRRVTKAGQENLPDIRDVVPDCPAEFSLCLQRFSKCNPQLRPANAKEAIGMLQRVGQGSRHDMRKLVRALPDQSNCQLTPKAAASMSSSLATVAVAGMMIAMFVSYGIYRGLIPSVASMTPSANTLSAVQTEHVDQGSKLDRRTEGVDESNDRSRVLQMPQPDAAGVVVLQSGRTYLAADLNFPGVMHIEATGNELSRVLVPTRQSWNLSARQLTVSNVHVLQSPLPSSIVETKVGDSVGDGHQSESPTSVRATADVVSIRQCIIESTVPDSKAVCLNWQVSTGTTATVQLKDCVFRSNGTGFSTSVVPQRFHLENTLMLVKRSSVRATIPTEASASWVMTLNRVTQPSGLTFADFLLPSQSSNPCRVIVTAGESVLAPSLAVVQIASRANKAAVNSQVEFRLPDRGNAVVVPPELPVAVAWDNLLKTAVAISDDKVVDDSILPAIPVFRGDGGKLSSDQPNPWSTFQLVDYEGPKLTSELQGVLIEQLPAVQADDD